MESMSAQVLWTRIMLGILKNIGLLTWYVFTLSQAPVSWCCTLSPVELSMTEAEYMAMTEAMKEAIWLQGLMNYLGIEHDFLKVNCHSMSAIYLAKNQVYHAKMKHIDIKHHFVRDILEGDIELKVHTKNNLAAYLLNWFPKSNLIIARVCSEFF